MKIIHSNGKVTSIIPMQDEKGYYLSTASLSSGNYFLRIKSASGLETIAFMKQ
jgi:hypothetical protein